MLTLESLDVQQDGFGLQADLTVKAGQITGVIGPSGGGKSTLLNAIAGFIMPTSGRVMWKGCSMDHLAPGDRPVSMVFQDNNLFPHLTAFQNVALGARPSLRLTTDELNRVEKALKGVGLQGFGARKPSALSGGQQSRVALARVLVRQQPLLLLDEPFAALGPALRQEMLDLVKEVAQANNATVLMVTHNPDDAIRITDETIYVQDGKVHKPVATNFLMENPPDELRNYLGS